MEIWKDIPIYKWFYQASNLWEVRSLDRYVLWRRGNQQIKKWKILKKQIRWIWYYAVDISIKWKIKSVLIHRLVASTFLWLDLKNTKIKVCHNDDNPLNNKLDNLFLWTQKDNIQDMFKKWRQHNRQWENWWNSKLKKEEVIEIKRLLKEWGSQQKIAKRYNVWQQLISLINTWKRWKHII